MQPAIAKRPNEAIRRAQATIGAVWIALAGMPIEAGISQAASLQLVSPKSARNTPSNRWNTGTNTGQRVATASLANVTGTTKRTRFSLNLSKGVTAEIFTLADPYRVIVDLPNVKFALPADAGRMSTGLVSSFRYGLFAEDKARIVIDTTGPTRIEAASMVASKEGGEAVAFSFEIVATSPESFGRGTGAKRAAQPRPAEPSTTIPRQKKRTAKPIVVIDPGHGGVDGGAVSINNVLEKNVVLAVSKAVVRELKQRRHYEIKMTRKTDVFVSLDKRVAMSQKYEADLFISLHADSLGAKLYAQAIRGATIYTLSEKASDEQARLRAEKENASDLAAGLQVEELKKDNEVRSILFDLLKRETANFSTDFSNVLLGKFKKRIKVTRSPQRSAAFRVLKQTDTPSVLIELGYLSNLEDEKLLKSSTWQRKVANAISDAVDSYFIKRDERGR